MPAELQIPTLFDVPRGNGHHWAVHMRFCLQGRVPLPVHVLAPANTNMKVSTGGDLAGLVARKVAAIPRGSAIWDHVLIHLAEIRMSVIMEVVGEARFVCLSFMTIIDGCAHKLIIGMGEGFNIGPML